MTHTPRNAMISYLDDESVPLTLRLLTSRTPQPGDYDAYGVPVRVQVLVTILYRRRNECPEDEIEPVTREILAALRPYCRI